MKFNLCSYALILTLLDIQTPEAMSSNLKSGSSRFDKYLPSSVQSSSNTDSSLRSAPKSAQQLPPPPKQTVNTKSQDLEKENAQLKIELRRLKEELQMEQVMRTSLEEQAQNSNLVKLQKANTESQHALEELIRENEKLTKFLELKNQSSEKEKAAFNSACQKFDRWMTRQNPDHHKLSQQLLANEQEKIELLGEIEILKIQMEMQEFDHEYKTQRELQQQREKFDLYVHERDRKHEQALQQAHREIESLNVNLQNVRKDFMQTLQTQPGNIQQQIFDVTNKNEQLRQDSIQKIDLLRQKHAQEIDDLNKKFEDETKQLMSELCEYERKLNELERENELFNKQFQKLDDMSQQLLSKRSKSGEKSVKTEPHNEDVGTLTLKTQLTIKDMQIKWLKNQLYKIKNQQQQNAINTRSVMIQTNLFPTDVDTPSISNNSKRRIQMSSRDNDELNITTKNQILLDSNYEDYFESEDPTFNTTNLSDDIKANIQADQTAIQMQLDEAMQNSDFTKYMRDAGVTRERLQNNPDLIPVIMQAIEADQKEQRQKQKQEAADRQLAERMQAPEKADRIRRKLPSLNSSTRTRQTTTTPYTNQTNNKPLLLINSTNTSLTNSLAHTSQLNNKSPFLSNSTSTSRTATIPTNHSATITFRKPNTDQSAPNNSPATITFKKTSKK